MKKTPQVFWGEGMFLRPHHFQAAERYREEALQREIQRIQPFSYGLSGVSIAEDQLENFIFEIRDVSLKLKDGTALSSDSTLRLFPRGFKRELDLAGGRMRVFLGVPVMRETSANVFAPGEGPGGQDRRYVVESVEMFDENSGSNSQPLSIKRCNGRLFFGNESREGYECLEVAVVERSAVGRNFPVLAQDFIPSVTEIGASRTLQILCDEIMNRVEGKYRLLMSEFTQGRMNLRSGAAADWQPIIKYKILGSFRFLLQQLTKIPRIHPFAVYAEFCRLAGELSIFDDSRNVIELPVYDHDNLGTCFRRTSEIIEMLLEKLVASRYVKVEFVLDRALVEDDSIYKAVLKPEWLVPETEFFVAVEGREDDILAKDRYKTIKLGSPGDIPTLKRGNLWGLDLDPLKQAPVGLPVFENLHYFKIRKEPPYWPNVVRDRVMALGFQREETLQKSLEKPGGPDSWQPGYYGVNPAFPGEPSRPRMEFGKKETGEIVPIYLKEVMAGKLRFSLYIITKPVS